jgi:hypothetical protein
MTALQEARNLLFGAMVIAGCSERNDPTGSRALPPASFAAIAPLTSAVTDPVGDLENKGSDYQDIIRAEIAKQATNFTFVLTLVATVPDSPALPSGADVIVWQFLLDTDPTASPAGYPFTKNTAFPSEFMIQYRVYRSGFTDPLDPTSSAGVLVDRRPLLTGGQAIVTPIKASIDGPQITFVANAALLGDPPAFSWVSGTCAAKAGDDAKNGYSKHFCFDLAPDVNSGAPLASWPQ